MRSEGRNSGKSKKSVRHTVHFAIFEMTDPEQKEAYLNLQNSGDFNALPLHMDGQVVYRWEHWFEGKFFIAIEWQTEEEITEEPTAEPEQEES